MADIKALHIIEALRSGIPSRAVGEYFSEARPGILKKISNSLENVRETGCSSGMIYTGRYGEGKTHLMNTLFGLASSSNMVVSFLPLGKETPLDKLYLLYPKIIANTYLPQAMQPGFRNILEELTPGSSITNELLAYTAKTLETDKLYYLLRALTGTQDEDEKSAFLADLEGDFVTSSIIRKSYKNVTGLTAKFNKNFSKTKHAMDYYRFCSHLFREMGFDGWVILLDEAELIGRLGKKTRMNTYLRMQEFLNPDPMLESVFTVFSFSSSYVEDVIDKRNEFQNVEEVFSDQPEERRTAENSLNAIIKAPELLPLTGEEIRSILMSIQEFHGRAYDWNPVISEDTLFKTTQSGGYLLRTQIRAAIEFLDQLYQYGEAGDMRVSELKKEVLEEDAPDLGEMLKL